MCTYIYIYIYRRLDKRLPLNDAVVRPGTLGKIKVGSRKYQNPRLRSWTGVPWL